MATITGTDASDFLVGTADADIVNGGLGNDTIRGLGGNDTLNGAEGNDDLDGGDGNDYLIGGAGDDTLQGGMNADTLEGGAGNDVLRGGKGFDSIDGGDGNDTIYSGLGQDTLTGGAGADVFVLRGEDPNFPGALKAPTITDFVAGTDTIAIEGATADEITAALTAQTTVDGGVQFSINGATIVVKGTGLTSLSANDVTTEDGIPENNPGQTFTLTTNVETVTGTGGNDTVNGIVSSTAADSTLQTGDIVNAGDGTDQMNVTAIVGGDFTSSGWQSNSVEQIYVRAVDNVAATAHTVTVNLGSATGATQAWNSNSSSGAAANSDTVAFTDVAAGTTIGVRNATNVNTSATFVAAATSGTADNVAIVVDGVKSTAVSDGKINIAAGFESATLTASGSASTIGALTLNGSTKLTIDGSANVQIRAALDNAVTTVDASAATGNVNVVAGTSTTIKFTGGSGNDTFTTGAIAATGAAVNGGAGTDTLVIGAAAHLTSASGKFYSNFETLQVNGAGAHDVEHLKDNNTITKVVLNVNAANVTNLNATQAGNVELKADAAGGVTIGVKNAADVGQLDTVTLTMTATNADRSLSNATIAGVETLEIVGNTGTGASKITAFDHQDTTKVVLSGGSAIEFTTAAVAANVNSVIDGSDATGKLTINASATTTNGLRIEGGSAADTITGTGQNDIILGGAGNDIITGGAGADTMTGGDGADQFRYAAVPAATDVIMDFTAGTDKVGFSAAAFAGAGFAGTTATAAGATLVAADYQTRADVAAVAAGDDQKLVELQSAQTTAQLSTGTGGAAEAFVVAFNSTTGKGQIWYDADWSDAAGRQLVATLDNITTLAGITGLENTDFVFFT